MCVVTLLVILLLIGLIVKVRPYIEFPSGRLSRPYDRTRSKPLTSMGDDQFIELAFGRVHYIYRSSSSSSQQSSLNVFVHGFSIPMQMWQNVFQSVVEMDEPCLVFDLYGRGWSDAPPHPMTVDLFVSQLTELLYALNLPYATYNLFGVSMGGVIVQRFAELHPQRVSKLILCCSAGLKVVQPPEILLSLLAIPFLGAAIFKKVMTKRDNKAVRSQWAYPDRDAYREFQELFRQACNEHPGYVRSLFSTVRSFDFQSIKRPIENFHRPTLILWGDRDTLVPVENAYRYQHFYPHASLKIIAGANHSLLIEHGDEAADAIRDFLQKNN